MEFGINYFQCRISSTERINYISLDARYFYRIYSVCRVLFSSFSGISLEDVDQGYNIDVVEEWLPDEDLLILTIKPISGGQFVQNIPYAPKKTSQAFIFITGKRALLQTKKINSFVPKSSTTTF